MKRAVLASVVWVLALALTAATAHAQYQTNGLNASPSVPALVPSSGQTINANCQTQNPLPSTTNILLAPGVQITFKNAQGANSCNVYTVANSDGTLLVNNEVNVGTAITLCTGRCTNYSITIVAGQTPVNVRGITTPQQQTTVTGFTIPYATSAGTSVVIGPIVSSTSEAAGSVVDLTAGGDTALAVDYDGTQYVVSCEDNGDIYLDGSDTGLSSINIGGVTFNCVIGPL